MASRVEVATVGELSDGDMKAVEVGDRTIVVLSVAGDLFAIDDEGASQELDSQLKLFALAPRPAGGLFAIDGSHNDIVVIDEDGRVATTLVDSTTSPGAPGHLVSDAGGGLFFSAGSGDSSGVFYLAAGADTPVPVADVTDARGLALSANGGRLWVNASGDYTVWVFDVGEGDRGEP